MDAKRPTVCPFCKGGVPADLLQFGGNCPRCLLEIPGEEAPTDPGAVARQKAAAEAVVKAKSDRKRNALYGVLAAFALAAVAGVVIVQAQQEKAARTYEMPDDLYMPPLQEAVAAPPAAADAAVAAATPGARPTKGRDGGAKGLTALGAAPNLGDPNIAAALAAGTPPPSGMQQPISGPRGSTANATIDAPLAMSTGVPNTTVAMDATPITVSAGDKPLSDESEVFAMIKQIMSRYNPQIQNCYNSRLKQVPDLAGGWKLSFAVQKDGSVKGVSVDPVGSHDTLLEACMAKTVAAWRFGRITYEQPVTKTIRFGSNGW